MRYGVVPTKIFLHENFPTKFHYAKISGFTALVYILVECNPQTLHAYLELELQEMDILPLIGCCIVVEACLWSPEYGI